MYRPIPKVLEKVKASDYFKPLLVSETDYASPHTITQKWPQLLPSLPNNSEVTRTSRTMPYLQLHRHDKTATNFEPPE